MKAIRNVIRSFRETLAVAKRQNIAAMNPEKREE